MSPLFATRALVVAIALAVVLLAGCESYWRRKELDKEQQQLEERRALLKQTIDRETAGKTAFTDQEKARLGALWKELQDVEAKLNYNQDRLQESG